MNKILITCDFLTTRIATQEYHLRWFWILMNRTLSAVVAEPVIKFDSKHQEILQFNRKIFFNLSHIDVNEETPHFYFNPSSIKEESTSYLSDILSDFLVIGYELSLETKSLLNKAGITFIDIWLHPIRFMDDNFYAYQSNCESIQRKFRSHQINESVFYLYADRLQIHSFMGFNKFYNKIDKNLLDNSCLFIGQTLTDKSVCKNGKMLTVLDFKEEFRKLASSYTHVYFSPHPMLRGSMQDQIEFLKTFKNVSLITSPAYELLCSEKIKKVVAISSSVVYEAKFFGKDTSYLFKPSVEISEKDGEDGFISIFGKLHSPLFWRDILSEKFKVKEILKDTDFLDSRSIYRDMLSLYYNNQVFDKGQFIFNELQNIKKQKQFKKDETNKKKVNNIIISNSINYERIIREFTKYDTISFDLFDTLLQRKTQNSSDILQYAAQLISTKYGIDREEFLSIRQQARNEVIGHQEVTLQERYRIIGNRLGVATDIAQQFREIEEEIDKKLLEKKDIGFKLFNEAIRQGKEVLIISDTYYDHGYICSLLDQHGYKGYSALYLSSDHDKTKSSGDLFKIVKEKHKGKILHIGDNEKSDYTQSVRQGYSSILIKDNYSQICHLNGSYKPFLGQYGQIKTGLSINNLASFPIVAKKPGYTQGSAYKLGYNVVGEIFLNFAKWIYILAKRENINHLVFLARDGEIIKKAFDSLKFSGIRTDYLLASRRSVRVSSIYTQEDVKHELNDLISNIRTIDKNLIKYLNYRLGITLGTKDSEVVLRLTNKEEIAKYLTRQEIINSALQNAANERIHYLKYLKKFKITEKSAFVDIGHNGSLQKAIGKLLKLTTTTGFYFATYSKIKSTFTDLNGTHKAFGYLRNEFDESLRTDLYIKFALVIETLFLNDKGSFIRINNQGSPEFLPIDKERARVKFIKLMQKGVLDYIKNYRDTIEQLQLDQKITVDVSADEACERLFEILQHPKKWDAEIFQDVTLENIFGGRKDRVIVTDKQNEIRNSLWRQGSIALCTEQAKRNDTLVAVSVDGKLKNLLLKRPYPIVYFANCMLSLIKKIYIARHGANSVLVRKLMTNEREFYQDTKNEFVKRLWHVANSVKEK